MKRPATPTPTWESSWPGRYQKECRALTEKGISYRVDSSALARGQLIIDLEWSFGGRVWPLRAHYPDAFPRSKPEVQLVGPREHWPARHCSPLDGMLCLLGRNSRQWPSDWTLVDLLSNQFGSVIEGGDEDPQGEPEEVWWNFLSETTESRFAYCVVDSSWDLGAATGGTLTLAYDLGYKPEFHFAGAVKQVRTGDGAVIAEAYVSPPALSHTTSIPWVRLESTLRPVGGDELGKQLSELVNLHPSLKNARLVKFSMTSEALVGAIAYPMELGWQREGLGWLFFIVPKKGPQRDRIQIVRTLRAGPTDLLGRSPDVAVLKERTIALYGTGAIGSPLAVDLARNGVQELRLIEHDVVEPGNSVRWALGAPAWGRLKNVALRDFLAEHYPLVNVSVFSHHIGAVGARDDDLAGRELEGIDLVIDTTASFSAMMWLSDQARKRGLPLLSSYASQDVAGGVVGAFAPEGACPMCLEYAWKELGAPDVFDRAETEQVQPAGCAERTFLGSSVGLQEISLQTARLAIDWKPEDVGSLVAFLEFRADEFGIRRPQWSIKPIPLKADCSCRRSLPSP